MQGRITAIKRSKGFGFIRDNAHTDRFFHANSCLTPFESLQEGDLVEFESFTQEGARGDGLRARRVLFLEADGEQH